MGPSERQQQAKGMKPKPPAVAACHEMHCLYRVATGLWVLIDWRLAVRGGG